jgi:hypothetical protein
MARTKAVATKDGGIIVQLTVDEEAECDRQEANHSAKAPQRAIKAFNEQRRYGKTDTNTGEVIVPGYGSIEDQLGMQYDDLINGTTTWLDHCSSVKAAHPKETN